MFTKLGPSMVSVVLTLLLSGATVRAADPVRIVVGGPSTAKKLAPMKADLEKIAGTSVEVSVNPVDLALINVSKGIVDAMIGPLDETFAAAEKRANQKFSRDDFQFFDISTSQLNVALHPSNPSKELSQEQITAILSGQTKTWESINGQKAPIKVLMAKNYVAAMTTLNQFYIKAPSSPIAEVVLNKDGLLNGLKGNPNAIAFFTARETLPDFSPKFFQAHVVMSNSMVANKKVRPDVQKVLDYLKANPIKD